jgi:hypothetical protein
VDEFVELAAHDVLAAEDGSRDGIELNDPKLGVDEINADRGFVQQSRNGGR